MSSFWNLFGKEEKPAAENGGEQDEGGAEAGEQPATATKQASLAPNNNSAAGGGAPQLEAGGKPPPVLPPARTQPRYGIDEAIRLMRTLPVDDNVDLVVRVIKRTLESLSVKVPDIIEDAGKRQDQLRAKISEHQAAIVQLEREIDARRFDIGRLEDELAETTQVRERLQLAEALPTTPQAPKVAPPTGSSAITGQSGQSNHPPPPSVQKKPPLPTTFRPKPNAHDAAKATAPATPAANKDVAAKKEEASFPAPGEAKKAEDSKPKAAAAADEDDATAKKDESPAAKKDDDDDDDDEPVESRDMIEKIEKT